MNLSTTTVRTCFKLHVVVPPFGIAGYEWVERAPNAPMPPTPDFLRVPVRRTVVVSNVESATERIREMRLPIVNRGSFA